MSEQKHIGKLRAYNASSLRGLKFGSFDAGFRVVEDVEWSEVETFFET
jgi:hypothetical protein